jgi:hypothetical protein
MRNSQLCWWGFLVVATASVVALPLVWSQLSGRNTDYDWGGLAFMVTLLISANAGLLLATLWARRKEAAEKSSATAAFSECEPRPGEPDALVRLDFTHTFPHWFWISSVSYDSESPDGFRYKMFAVRKEPEMLIELLLVRETVGGPRRKVFHLQGPVANLGSVENMLRHLARDSTVCFERFDLTNVLTFEDFRIRALELGWEAAYTE